MASVDPLHKKTGELKPDEILLSVLSARIEAVRIVIEALHIKVEALKIRRDQVDEKRKQLDQKQPPCY